MAEIVGDSIDQTQETVSLSESDISILLGRALQEGRPLPMLDLRNCTDNDIYIMRLMIAQEISLRLLREDFVVMGLYEKAGILTLQRHLEDRALSSSQIETLRMIDRNLGEAQYARMEAGIAARRKGRKP